MPPRTLNTRGASFGGIFVEACSSFPHLHSRGSGDRIKSVPIPRSPLVAVEPALDGFGTQSRRLKTSNASMDFLPETFDLHTHD
jgi:hypothetical protein